MDTGKRFFEVDNRSGILYYFNSWESKEKQRPRRLYLLSELHSVQPIMPTASAFSFQHSFELRFKCRGATGKTEIHKLLLRAETEIERQRWVNGLQDRMRKNANYARRVGFHKTGKFGVTVINIAAQAIGVEVIDLNATDDCAQAGMQKGDTLLAINGEVGPRRQTPPPQLRVRPPTPIISRHSASQAVRRTPRPPRQPGGALSHRIIPGCINLADSGKCSRNYTHITSLRPSRLRVPSVFLNTPLEALPRYQKR